MTTFLVLAVLAGFVYLAFQVSHRRSSGEAAVEVATRDDPLDAYFDGVYESAYYAARAEIDLNRLRNEGGKS